MRCLFHNYRFTDISEYCEASQNLKIDPIQLSRGRLNLSFACLDFIDLVVTRLTCNRQVSDHLYMDPSWMLLIVQLTPQRWGRHLSQPNSLFVVAPGTEYPNSVPEGFRCVEVAIRLDLASDLGLGHFNHLRGTDAVVPIPAAAAKRAEQTVEQLLLVSAANGQKAIDEELTAGLRERCLDLVSFLKRVGTSSMDNQKVALESVSDRRFALVQDALQIIASSPLENPPKIEDLADILSSTRRTLLSVFQETLGVSPSRYILARRLKGAHQLLISGESPSVTDAALDSGFEHFGRFSHHYRSLFGETPSITLRRVHTLSRDIQTD